eukprot:6160784-Pleurochrysis_carterae.AAC.1
MLKLAQSRYAKEIRRAAHHSGERRSCVRTAAADIADSSTHQVERDRPSRGRPPTARVIATINSQERIVVGIETRQPFHYYNEAVGARGGWDRKLA